MATSTALPDPPFPAVHALDTNAEVTQSHDQAHVNWASILDDVMARSRTAINSVDVNLVVQYGQTTFEGLIKPNVVRLIHACDDDLRLGSIIAAPILVSLFLAATFVALAFNAAILSILVVAVIAGTVMMLGSLLSLLVKLAISGIRNFEIPSQVKRALRTSRNAVDHVRGSRPYPYIVRSPVAMAIIGFAVGVNVWIVPALIKKIVRKQVSRRVPWRPRRDQSKWRKISSAVIKAVISVTVVVFKIGRGFFRKFAGEIASKLAGAIRLVLLGLVRIVHHGVRISLRKTAGLWPMMCFALFLYCLLLHYRTNKLAKKIDGRRTQVPRQEAVESSSAM